MRTSSSKVLKNFVSVSDRTTVSLYSDIMLNNILYHPWYCRLSSDVN